MLAELQIHALPLSITADSKHNESIDQVSNKVKEVHKY